jgi:hypothetical protein
MLYGGRRAVKRTALASVVLAVGGIIVTAGTTMAAFQIVEMSATSGEPGADIAMRVDASHLIGGLEQSELFLIPRTAHQASPEPARCDEIPGATVVGKLRWQSESVEFRGNTYPGYVGNGSFTVPDVERGIYVVSGILDDPYTGCHVFGLFGVGVELSDSATASPKPSVSFLSLIGFALLVASVFLRSTRPNGG